MDLEAVLRDACQMSVNKKFSTFAVPETRACIVLEILTIILGFSALQDCSINVMIIHQEDLKNVSKKMINMQHAREKADRPLENAILRLLL
jgi:hypothetical protein